MNLKEQTQMNEAYLNKIINEDALKSLSMLDENSMNLSPSANF